MQQATSPANRAQAVGRLGAVAHAVAGRLGAIAARSRGGMSDMSAFFDFFSLSFQAVPGSREIGPETFFSATAL